MTQLFKNTEWTDFLWNDYTRTDEDARGVLRHGEHKIAENFSDFAAEAFYRFYAADPKKCAESKSGTEWARKLHTAMDEIPEMKSLKNSCTGSDWKSGIATANALRNITKQVTPDVPFKDIAEDEEALNYLKQLLEDQDSFSDEDIEKLEGKIEKLEDALDTQKQEAQEACDNLDDVMVRNAVRACAAEAAEEIEGVTSALDGLGCGNDTHSGAKGQDRTAKKLANLLKDNDRLKEILQMAGRLKRLARSQQKAKPRRGTGEVAGLVQGDDLSRMLPSEGVLVMDPEMEVVFARKLQERAVAEYEVTEKPEEEQGPIVMLVDASGSMRCGHRDIWAAAVSLAFLLIAQDQKRDFCLMHFGTEVVRTFNFPAGKAVDTDKLIEAVTASSSEGGTNFEKPLTEALGVIRESTVYTKADIIMVTDGDARISQGFFDIWQEVTRVTETTCYSILIGRDAKVDTLLKFSDEVVSLTDVLRDEHNMVSLFGKV